MYISFPSLLDTMYARAFMSWATDETEPALVTKKPLEMFGAFDSPTDRA
jgi:hypothetical protein